MENLVSLENQVDDLKKQLWDLTKNVIPALEEKLDTALTPEEPTEPETPEVETPQEPEEPEIETPTIEWQTVYDMESDDATINWGYSSGIPSSANEITASCDFSQYSYMRIHWVTETTMFQMFEFYIKDALEVTNVIPYFGLLNVGKSNNRLNCLNVGLKLADSNERHFYVGSGKYYALSTTSYLKSTNLSSVAGYYISRIEVKP